MSASTFDRENLAALRGLQEGDVEPLIELLKETERSLHPELRRWIALMLMGDSQSHWWLECKRHKGFPRPDLWRLVIRDLNIGTLIHKHHTAGDSITDAKKKAADDFHLEEHTIDNAWTTYRRVYFSIREDGLEFSPDLRSLRRPKSPT